MENSAPLPPEHSVLHLTIPFTVEAISGICSMGDFYEATGLTVMMHDKTLTDVSQVWMNKSQCEGLQDIVRSNLKKSRKHKSLKGRTLDTAVAMDWLNYSPVGIPYVPENTLWIFTLEDAKTAIEEYRTWLKENVYD